jgi:patatin-related protein
MPYSREVRLGIVLYGGVSLAIYENGVAQELFHAVHGDGVYGLLKDLIDSDIAVDIISGTSAGGINGIYLAYAFANAKDFTKMSKLWREKGDIDKLLRSQHDPETKSLFDSRGYYQQELEEAFRSLPSHKPSPRSRPSPIAELDLFVTGTDGHGNLYTVYDDLGNPIDVKDHRAVFRLPFYRFERYRETGCDPRER